MPTTLAKKPLFLQMSLLLGAAAGGMLVARYINARHINGAEQLADALLHTDSLVDADKHATERPADALASCVAYFVQSAYHASSGIGIAGRTEDPMGYERVKIHPFTNATAMVLTEATESEHILTYTLTLPGKAEVRGTRRVGAERLDGVKPLRSTPERMEIAIGDYSAQLESEFEVGDFIVFGKVRLSGSLSVRDNQGNVGRIHVAEDGKVGGAMTRDQKITGRFDGHAESGVYYKANLLEGESDSSA